MASRRNQDLALFDEHTHGIRGLIVAYPGKASRLLALGHELARRVMAPEGQVLVP
jgi:hypothetical protein